MTTTARKSRLTADQMANTMRTGEEWLGIHRLAVQVASMWWACLVVGMGAAWMTYVQTGQAISVYSDLMRPMPPKLVDNMRKADQSAWTPETTRRMLPSGWNVNIYTRAVWDCANRPQCAPKLQKAAIWWTLNQPRNHAAQITMWATGGLLALTMPALLLQSDMRRWRDRETRQIQRNEREARRSARSRR